MGRQGLPTDNTDTVRVGFLRPPDASVISKFSSDSVRGFHTAPIRDAVSNDAYMGIRFKS